MNSQNISHLDFYIWKYFYIFILGYILGLTVAMVIITYMQDVQQKVKPFLVSANMAHFAYDNMMKVLDTINRYVCTSHDYILLCVSNIIG